MRILAIAYACEPGKGSEPGVGWAWSRMLARLGETCVITRANNRALIEENVSSLPATERPSFVYVDLPPWARFWKRGQRGVRLYYLLWLVLALRRARRLQRARSFDFVWHLTLTNIWLGSVGQLVGPPFVYGPMGGGGPSCWDPRIVGARGAAYEVARSLAVTLGRFLNPLARSSWRQAHLILTNNYATARWLPGRHRAKTEVLPNVVVDVSRQVHDRLTATAKTRRVALFAGRLKPLKGGSLAISAMQFLPDWQLTICGSGPDERRLRRIASKHHVENQVVFRGWMSRDDLLEYMDSEVTALLFPSLHDQAPWIVGEALTLGVPAICLDQSGPAALGATCVRLDGLTRTARALARAVSNASPDQLPRWDPDSRYEQLRRVLVRRGLLVDVGS
jgi:glycosyltransferase involved in cell wall biosynthesis